MGGSGGRGPTKEDLSRLEELARRDLREGSQPERRNVFISFAYEDINDVNLLRGQAKNENANIEFNDWSLREPFNSEKAEYVRSGIRERIRQSSVTLVYVSEQTAKSKWVNWEIQESIRQGKGVVAIHKGETPPRSLPSAVLENKDKVMLTKWTQKGLAAAIERASKDR